MANVIDSKAKRSKLEARREPYWHRLRAGAHLGFRVAEEGEGTWIAKYRDAAGQRFYRALGTIVDAPARPAFDQAAREARKWADECDRGARPKGETVTDVCKLYVENRKKEVGEKNSKDAEGRFNRLVYDQPIGKKHLTKLTKADIEKWRNDQVPDADDAEDEDIRKAKDSANRNLSTLKAALNFAFSGGLIGSDFAWRTVKCFDKVGRRRDRILTPEQRTALFEKCPDDLQVLCKALLLTAARPGEIASATVADFNKKRGTLKLDGKTGPRVVTLSTAAIAFFAEQTKDRIGNAPLVTRDDGSAWDRFAWRDLLRPTLRAAKLPRDVVLYSLRHTAISEMLIGGVNPSVVAQLAGTSTAMIDQHYGHLIHEGVRERLDAVQMY